MERKKSFSQKILSSRVWGPIGVGLAIVVACAVVMIAFWRIITESGTVPGADPTSFAHTAKVIVDYFKQTGHIPPIDFSWYAGFEHISTPPLITVFLGGIYYLTNNIEVALRIFQPAAVAIFFITMFFLIKKEGYPTLNAFLGGMVFAFMPTIFNTYGSYTKMVAIFFLPIAFYFTNQILTKAQIKHFIYLAIINMLIVLAHPMTGVVFSMFLVIYSVIYSTLDRRIVTRRFFLVIFSLLLGFLLASEYIVPFFFEKVNRTAIAAEEATINVGFSKIIYDFKAEIGGLIFMFIPLYVIWRQKDAKLTALYLTGLFSAFVFFGYYFGFGFYFPFSLSYGYIWFFMTGFAFAYLMGLTIPWSRIYNLATYFLRLEAVVVFLLFYFFSINNYIHFASLYNYTPDLFPNNYEMSAVLNSYDNDGRIFPTHYPFGMTNWIIGMTTNKANVEGHYFGISRIGKTIALVSDAIHNDYPNYVVKKLKDLNVRYVLANSVLGGLKNYQGTMVGNELMKKLEENNYKIIYKSEKKTEEGVDFYRLYYNDEPSTYLMPIDEKILVIGKYGPTLAAAVSPDKINILEGGTVYFDDYPIEFLRQFDTVVLYGFSFHNRVQAEQLAQNYVGSGGHLVVDLLNMGVSPLADNPRFLGVTSYSRRIEADMKINPVADAPAVKDMPTNFKLPGEISDTGTGVLGFTLMKQWNAPVYLGLDQPLATLPDDSTVFNVLGYKNVGENKVTFVGLNFFYHLYLTHDPKELNFVETLIQNPKKISQETGNVNEAQITREEWTPEKLKFQIKTDEPKSFLVSLAYSPHWKAFLDGQPIKILNIEDLMVVQVPSGSHDLELRYQPTKISILGWVVSGLTGLFLVFLVIFSKLKKARFSKSN